MPRVYKPNSTSKMYKKHSLESMKRALADHSRGMSYRKCSKKHSIPITVLYRHAKNPDIKSHGGQTAISKNVEHYLAERLSTCGSWGYPLDNMDIRLIVKAYLDRSKIKIKRFKDNMPSNDWVNSFVKRNSDVIAHRICQNIKSSRAAMSPEVVEGYFSNLEKTLEGIPPCNIMNYDETNLTDNPGKSKVVMKRGTKYPERILDHSKSAISLMAVQMEHFYHHMYATKLNIICMTRGQWVAHQEHATTVAHQDGLKCRHSVTGSQLKHFPT